MPARKMTAPATDPAAFRKGSADVPAASSNLPCRLHGYAYLRASPTAANPPLNDSDWFRKDDGVRWQPSGARSTAKGSPQGERGGVNQFGVSPKDYARPGLDKHRLGELIDLIGTISLTCSGGLRPSHDANAEESATVTDRRYSSHRSIDLLGRVYEYFLTRFASAEGKNGGQFYTPSCVVRCLVETLAPYKGRICDPACGSGGMFVQSEKFVESHGGKLGDISIYGQESNATTRRLAIMNLAIRGIEADIGKEHADTFRHVQHPDRNSHRRSAAETCADYALANGSMSSNQSAEVGIPRPTAGRKLGLDPSVFLN